MLFNIYFDIAALIFLSIIAYQFFSHKQFPLLSNKIFGAVVIVGLFDLVLDIAGTATLMIKTQSLVFIPQIINIFYYIAQLLVPSSLVLYILALLGQQKPLGHHVYVAGIIPSLIGIVVLLIGLPLDLVFVINLESDVIYSYGPLSSLTYVVFAIYFALTVFLVIKYFKSFTHEMRFAIFVTLAIILTGIILQFFFRNILLSGLALTCAIAMIYFTLQDPRKNIDEITGLFNVTAFKAFMNAKFESLKDFHLVVVKMHELHNFYVLYGRDNGDAILIKTADDIASYANTWTFRFGDSEFVSVFNSQAEADEYMFKLKSLKDEEFIVGAYKYDPIYTVLSLNNARRLGNFEILLRTLFNAIVSIKAKNIKGEQYTLTDDDIYYLERNADIEAEIRKALIDGEGFELFYQPIYSLKEEKFISCEALLRFNSPALGRISPGVFIPIIESRGLSTQMDILVVEKVFQHLGKGIFCRNDIKNVHVNLCGASFSSTETTNKIFELAKKYVIQPEKVVFEITETTASISKSVLIECVTSLVKYGFKLALDDFGTGYSNLTQVLTLPYHFIKVDKTIIQESINIIGGVTNLFKEFPVTLVAEGVENEFQLEECQKAGFGEIQGFYFAKPMPVEEFSDFLNKH